MKTLTKTTIAAAIALVMTITNGCKKEDMNNVAGTSDMSGAKGESIVIPPPQIPAMALELKMVSTPAEGLGAVDVEIVGAMVHFADNVGLKPGTRNWVTISTQANIYNLEQYHDGKSVTLAVDPKMPMGKIDEIRLLIGKKNSVVKADADGLRHVYPLIAMRSNQSADLKADIGMRKGTTLVVTVDFNAQKSVNAEGGIYLLTPTLTLRDVEYIPQMVSNNQ